jgi:excinuclease ABC subunit A
MNKTDISQYDPKENIIARNIHQNNLKNIDLVIPHNKLVVITGVSGSGKSSLAFETLYEEGRRRYVESLSAYVRQFLGKIKKPLVDYIKGLPPAIAIEQRQSSSNSRSTVGTVTEIYHYFKLLYARLGKTYSPVSGKEVKRHQVDDVVDFVKNQPEGTRLYIMSPVFRLKDRTWQDELEIILQKGFPRILIHDKIEKVEELLLPFIQPGSEKEKKIIEKGLEDEAYLLVDRIVVKDISITRIADSVQTAFYEGNGRCVIEVLDDENECAARRVPFSNTFDEDGITFEEPHPDLFSFNSPHGACPACNGFGELLGIDEDKVIPDKNLSLYDGAVLCWEGAKMSEWKREFILKAAKYDFPTFRSYNELSTAERNLLWDGNDEIEGIMDFFEFLESNTYKLHYRVFLSRFKGRTFCRTCQGTRLRKEASYVKIDGKGIGDLLNIPISDLHAFCLDFTERHKENPVARKLMLEINIRLKMMVDVGLGYLTLNRNSRTLSGGETQRIQLIYSIGSPLTGSLYILDEPSIGLHPKDTFELIKILQNLKSLGNSVVVVEHDEDIIRSADQIIDLGPFAGTEGGELVFQGTIEEIMEDPYSLTAKYLKDPHLVPMPESRRQGSGFIEISGARKFNLNNISIKFPANALTVVTGVSGSGKTTLVKEVIYESFKNETSPYHPEAVNCAEIKGAIQKICYAEFIGQDSIDRSRRSNPVTYLKIFDSIRELYASLQISKIRGYTPAFFSFNVEGGRCDECKGDGKILVEMQFVADMHLVCDSCGGKRYKSEILEATYNDKNIDDILNMTAREAMNFFKEHKNIITGLEPLIEVGLDYLKLGQPTSTLSGGEAQRLKLASFLTKGHRSTEPMLYIFDEPTTGLHWNDIHNLLNAMNALIEIGHTIMVIEHNLEVIKNADYIIDLGPGGGEHGGNIVFQGTPEEMTECESSFTAAYLKTKMLMKK